MYIELKKLNLAISLRFKYGMCHIILLENNNLKYVNFQYTKFCYALRIGSRNKIKIDIRNYIKSVMILHACVEFITHV